MSLTGARGFASDNSATIHPDVLGPPEIPSGHAMTNPSTSALLRSFGPSSHVSIVWPGPPLPSTTISRRTTASSPRRTNSPSFPPSAEGEPVYNQHMTSLTRDWDFWEKSSSTTVILTGTFSMISSKC